MKEKISNILFEELDYIYCNNCRFSDDNYDYTQEEFNSSPCEDCCRKQMKWEISKEFSEKLADKILDIIKDL